MSFEQYNTKEKRQVLNITKSESTKTYLNCESVNELGAHKFLLQLKTSMGVAETAHVCYNLYA
jgi:hypothetical protein